MSYAGRGYEAGKKITWKDGFEAIYCIIRYRFSSDVVEGRILEETLEKMSRLRHRSIDGSTERYGLGSAGESSKSAAATATSPSTC